MQTLTREQATRARQRPSATIEPEHVSRGSSGVVALLGDLAPEASERVSIESTIGEGGMGLVRLGTQRSLGRPVAVKTLKPDHRDPAAVRRLLREAWVTGALEHPNIVPVHDLALTADGQPQVILKRIDGVDWAMLLDDRTALLSRAEGADVEEWNLRTLMQVCNAMHFAHGRGIVHRDIKPENVMIGGYGEVYVVDWGIAVSLTGADARFHAAADATDLAGTPCYMAPEMLLGDAARLGPRTDVCSVPRSFTSSRVVPRTRERIWMTFFSWSSRPRPRSPRPCRASSLASAGEQWPGIRVYGAQQRLDEMMDELGESGTDLGHDERIHHLFGECRFGFRAALEAWPDNAAARGGLDLAITTVAERELAQKDAKAAALLLADLPNPPPALLRRLAALEQELAGRQVRAAELEALGRELDPATGSRTRTFVAGVLGVGWTCTPVVAQSFIDRGSLTPDPLFSVGVSAISLVIAASLGYWARDTMMKTQLNRQMFALLIFTLVAQIILGLTVKVSGLIGFAGFPLNFFLWHVAMGYGAITIERRLWPSSAGYLVGLAVSLAAPELSLYAAAAGHAVLTVNFMLVWAPLFSWKIPR